MKVFIYSSLLLLLQIILIKEAVASQHINLIPVKSGNFKMGLSIARPHEFLNALETGDATSLTDFADILYDDLKVGGGVVLIYQW